MPDDGDWLFSSEAVCKKHRPTGHAQCDLDSAFETPEKALAEFADVIVPEGRKLLYDHANQQFQAAEMTQATERDKAKQLLGTTSLTLALISASLALLRDWLTEFPVWAMIIVLALFVWVVSHFLRALLLSIRAITRDETIAVSTQAVVDVLKESQEKYEDGHVYQRLAADLRWATTETNSRLLARINRVILAQTSFRWGLTLLPVLFGLYVLFALIYAEKPTSTPAPNDGTMHVTAPATESTGAGKDTVLKALETLRSDLDAIRQTTQQTQESTKARIGEMAKQLESLHMAMEQRRALPQGPGENKMEPTSNEQ